MNYAWMAPIPLEIALQRSPYLSGIFAVPGAKDEKGQAEVWLCPVIKSVPVVIGRGENSGHTLTYTNVVRAEIRLGRAEAEETRLEAGLGPLRQAGATRFAVIVQRGEAGPILGAAAL